MELRKTILYIGHNGEEQNKFIEAIEQDGKQFNFLSLEKDSWTSHMLRKSQPFWYSAIILELDNTSAYEMEFLREIRNLRQLQHVPVVIYMDNSKLSDLYDLRGFGATHYISRPFKTEKLLKLFKAFRSNELLPFIISLPVSDNNPLRLRKAS